MVGDTMRQVAKHVAATVIWPHVRESVKFFIV